MITMTTSITSGQNEQASRVTKDALVVAVDAALGQLIADGEIDRAGVQRFLGRGDRLKMKLIPLIKNVIIALAAAGTSCLKCISVGKKLMLDPTDGKKTFVNAKAVFLAHLDRDFERWGLDVPSPATGPTNVEVHKMVENGKFTDVFGGFGVELGKLAFTQDQAVEFVEKHQNWLCPDDWGTFLLIKVKLNSGTMDEKEEFFVVYVRWFGGKLGAFVRLFSDDRVWFAVDRVRVVVPQLKLES